MNKTKRKIFETAMQLFADKGYEATSIEEITATVGVAKGTLYYHFSSKEEIFNFLVEEGMKLLKNSIQIKTDKVSSYIDKIRAIILIQIKVIVKYESLITIILSQMWGKEERNKRIHKALKILNKREYEIICRRFGLDGYSSETQREIAKSMGISRSYVSRIETKAIEKLAKEIKE